MIRNLLHSNMVHYQLRSWAEQMVQIYIFYFLASLTCIVVIQQLSKENTSVHANFLVMNFPQEQVVNHSYPYIRIFKKNLNNCMFQTSGNPRMQVIEDHLQQQNWSRERPNVSKNRNKKLQFLKDAIKNVEDNFENKY